MYGEGLVGDAIVKAIENNPNIEIHTNRHLSESRLSQEYLWSSIDRIHHEMVRAFGKPDVVINAIGAVGKPNVEWCETNKVETWFKNVEVAECLYDFYDDLHIPFIHISTGCIFTDLDGGKVFEPWDTPNFEGSYYSFTKMEAEKRLPHADIHRIRMPFMGYADDRNLLTKILTYKTVVDSKNSMTSLTDYAVFVAGRVAALSAGFQPSIHHAVNTGAMSHREILEMIKEEAGHSTEKEYITPRELNDRVRVPRSNCILGQGELPPLRESMLRDIKMYFDESEVSNVKADF